MPSTNGMTIFRGRTDFNRAFAVRVSWVRRHYTQHAPGPQRTNDPPGLAGGWSGRAGAEEQERRETIAPLARVQSLSWYL
jgi:hypothetical protein